MRSAAEIHPVALLVNRNLLPFRDAAQDFDLVMLSHPLEGLDRFGARHLDPLNLEVGLRQFAHLLLDLRQILQRERMRRGEVVEKSVLDSRPDRHLRAGEQGLDRLRHQMGGRMANDLDALGTVGQHRLDRRIFA